MKYSHTVKHDGVIYPAGTEVPAGSIESKPEEIKPVKKPVKKKK